LNDNGVILEREIANIREDLRTRISTRGDNFAMTVKNEMFTDRVKAGRAVVFAARLLSSHSNQRRQLAPSAAFRSQSKGSMNAQRS